jgi:V8-like Glu-specific endopeptidase
MRPPSASALALLGSALSLAACATAPAIPVRPAAIAHPHVHPQVLFSPPLALASPEDAVVRVVGPEMSCSGTLIEDDLVLTAHHCIVKRGAHGEFTREKVSPGEIQIELGGDYLAWGTVRARAVVAPPCGAAGGAGDLAILVLERKLVGMSTMTPRLDAPPRMGETVDPIGFGRCALSPNGIHRSDRLGGNVVATTQETFVLQASICPGDSGGPVVSRGTHEIVGVVSQSAMDGDERTRNATILARIDVYRSVFATARLVADGADPSELPPVGCAP